MCFKLVMEAGKEISRREYIHGKGRERKNPYLNHSGLSAIVL